MVEKVSNAEEISASASDALHESHTHSRGSLATMAMGAIGVVFGDNGTSPLYAMKEVFVGPHPLTVDRLHIESVLYCRALTALGETASAFGVPTIG